MLFFRSEADVEEWKRERRVTTGQVISLATLWELSQLWYGNRLDYTFQGRSLEQAQDTFRAVGLTDAFWYKT